MDEADVLGDRIAIMSNGKLNVHGTSFFLKKHFGQGYYLTLTKKQLESGETSKPMTSSTSSDNLIENSSDAAVEIDTIGKEKLLVDSLATKQDRTIYDFVKDMIPSATLTENIGQEMTFSISNQVEATKNYENFFKELEGNAGQLGIDSIGISETTLEEIFIKLAKEPESNFFAKKPFILCNVNLTSIYDRMVRKCCGEEPIVKLEADQLEKYAQLTNERVTNKVTIAAKQFTALLFKRFHRVKRNIKGRSFEGVVILEISG